MLELEPELAEYNSGIIRKISEQYPQMSLCSPLPLLEEGQDVPGMNSCERNFAILLQSRGLSVFREPIIGDIDFKPDFFVYNPLTERGKIVEITQLLKEVTKANDSRKKTSRRKKRSKKKETLRKRKTLRRKERQLERLTQTGIPYVVLYREDLVKIKGYCWENLF